MNCHRTIATNTAQHAFAACIAKATYLDVVNNDVFQAIIIHISTHHISPVDLATRTAASLSQSESNQPLFVGGTAIG